MVSFNPWLSRGYPAGDAPFNPAQAQGMEPVAHDRLDAQRMAWRRVPQAEYPDGYLGSVPTRRGDSLMQGLKDRQNNRPYTRGIHKGERIERRDYFWADEFNLMSGIVNQSRTMEPSPDGGYRYQRYVSPALGGLLKDERYPQDRQGMVPRAEALAQQYRGQGPWPNPDRSGKLTPLAPPWDRPSVPGRPSMSTPYPGR